MRTRCWKNPNYSQWSLLFSGSGSRALFKQKSAVCWPGFTSQPFSQETWPHLNSHLCACDHCVRSLQVRRRHAARAADKLVPSRLRAPLSGQLQCSNPGLQSDTSLRLAPKENVFKGIHSPLYSINTDNKLKIRYAFVSSGVFPRPQGEEICRLKRKTYIDF